MTKAAQHAQHGPQLTIVHAHHRTCRAAWTSAAVEMRLALSGQSEMASHTYSILVAYLVDRLQVQRQVGVVDGIILGTIVDVWDLADVILLLLFIVEGLEQLAPPVKHEQQPLAATWHSPLDTALALWKLVEKALFWRLKTLLKYIIVIFIIHEKFP